MTDMINPITKGRFIVFEGGEGSGKSTQVKALVAFLRARGLEVIQTREPGGSTGAEALRQLLVTGDAGRWSPVAEVLMMYAARADHVEKIIRPALERGAWVISDRFSDSSRAYQGTAGGVPSDLIDMIDRYAVGETQPDLVFVMDIDVETGLSRAKSRGGDEQRFESKGESFHAKIRQTFLQRARIHPERYCVIDANQPIDSIKLIIQDHCLKTFAELRANS